MKKQNELKQHHFILAVIFLPICLFTLFTYSWIGYATLTEKPGLNGNYYLYFNLTRPQFYIYNFVVAFIALALIVAQVNYLIRKKPQYLTMAFWAFAIFITLVIACEIYLQTRFTGKG